MVQRFKDCLGITLFKMGRIKVELWIVPPKFRIEEHTHPSQDIKIMYLWGNATFFRNDYIIHQYKSFNVSLRRIFKCFTVMHYHNHYFYNYDKTLVFINFERYFGKPTSASEDIKFNLEDYAEKTR